SAIIIALNVAIPTSSLLITRNLASVSALRQVNISKSSRTMYFEIAIGTGIPLLAVLARKFQGHRFDIIECLGCWPAVWMTPIAILLVLLPPIVINLVSAYYASIAIRAIFIQRRQFRKTVLTATGLPFSTYLRLMALATTEIIVSLPAGIFVMFLNLRDGVNPWTSWTDTHLNFNRVEKLSFAWYVNTCGLPPTLSIPTTYGMSPPESADPVSYPRTTTYLQLVSERITNNTGYLTLCLRLTQVYTYITTISRHAWQSEILQDRFGAVMKQANRIQTVIEGWNQNYRIVMVVSGALLTAVAMVVGGILLVAGAVVVAPVLAVGALGLVGFSAIGPIAGRSDHRSLTALVAIWMLIAFLGSIAAAIQSVIYGGAVGAGSLFALCQSAAMGGIVVGSLAEIAAGVAELVTGAASLLGGVLVGLRVYGGTNGDNNTAALAPNPRPTL
ncbi:a-factor receptor, partial [Tulasnella sp. 427]